MSKVVIYLGTNQLIIFFFFLAIVVVDLNFNSNKNNAFTLFKMF